MNPSTSKVVSANQTPLPNNNNSNNPVAYNPQGYNTFDRTAPHLSSCRFDEVKPFYCVPEIEGNVARVRTAHNLQTDTLNSRLLSNIKMDKSFYQVPWSAIAPHSWEFMYRQPIKGDDISFMDVFQSATYYDLCSNIKAILKSCIYVPSSASSTIKYSEFYFRAIGAILGSNCIFGNSSLLKSIGVSMPNEDLIDEYKSLLVDSLMYSGLSIRLEFTDSDNIVHRFNNQTSSLSVLYQFLEDFEFHSTYIASLTNYPLSITILQDDYIDFNDLQTLDSINPFLSRLIGKIMGIDLEFVVPTDTSVSVNLMPVIAYQLICAQFYSNSSIDDFYTGKMWLDNVNSLLRNSLGVSNHPFYLYINSNSSSSTGILHGSREFKVNGVYVPYDAYNGFYMHSLLTSSTRFVEGGINYNVNLTKRYYCQFLAFWSTLFGIQRSLKYGDYFVSSRTRPFAVGDTNISVVNNNVNVLDVNKSLWTQRFVNAVNRIPQTISEYIKRLTGVEPQNIAPQPHWICTESFNVAGMEIENTAENQGNVVTLLRNEESRYMYEVFIDEPSFVFGIRSFVAENVYPKSTFKINFMNDRLDWFNHFAQHFGDESVNYRELQIPDKDNFGDVPISYQVRYSGFKYGISRASGAFSFKNSPLKSWAIMPDYDNSFIDGIPVLSSSFIRNRNIDVDGLFASLTATNNALRYHFIIKDFVDDSVNSRQAKFPSIDV